MAEADQRLRVCVSSTVGEAGELAVERRAVERAISALRLVRDDLATLLSEQFAATRQAYDPESVPLPSPRSRRRGPRPLPVGTTSLVGREQAIDEVAGLLDRPDVRLVTLTGPGGVGKTRLAVAVGERLGGRFGAGAVFVPLAAVNRPELVLAGIGRALVLRSLNPV
jgi:hypothetical protein